MSNENRKKVTEILTRTTESNMKEYKCTKKEASKMAIERLIKESPIVAGLYFLT